jgi:hypothetical protein
VTCSPHSTNFTIAFQFHYHTLKGSCISAAARVASNTRNTASGGISSFATAAASQALQRRRHLKLCNGGGISSFATVAASQALQCCFALQNNRPACVVT